MYSKAVSVEKYLEELEESRRIVISRIRDVINENLPVGFQEVMSSGMIGYVVPLSIFPQGYKNDTSTPLPFINIASQKNYISLYHMGIYADDKLLKWFKDEYEKRCKHKIDMGKSCIRFKKFDDIPYDLIGELSSKITVDEWIEKYVHYTSNH